MIIHRFYQFKVKLLRAALYSGVQKKGHKTVPLPSIICLKELCGQVKLPDFLYMTHI